MKTEQMPASLVENNEFVVRDGVVMGYVYMNSPGGHRNMLDVVNAEGEHTILDVPAYEILDILVD